MEGIWNVTVVLVRMFMPYCNLCTYYLYHYGIRYAPIEHYCYATCHIAYCVFLYFAYISDAIDELQHQIVATHLFVIQHLFT